MKTSRARLTPPHLAIQTLGAFNILRDGAAMPEAGWGTHRAKALFKLLLTAYGKTILREQICDALWNEASPEAAARNLYVAASDLRRLLEPQLRKPADSNFILSTGEGYQFNPASPHTLDKKMFVEQIAAARAAVQRHTLADAAQAYAQAEALYAGDYLPDDVYADWSIAEREHLRNLLLTTLLEQAEVQAQLGRYRQAMANCRRALTMDNCLEEAYRGLMTYLYASGDRGQALRVFAECQAALKRELDTAPLPSTIALAEQIKNQRVHGVDEDQKYPAPAKIALPHFESLAQMPLVGRERELAQLAQYQHIAAAGSGALIFVEGETGIGKSYLLDYFWRDASIPVLRTLAHELTIDLPYHLLGQIFRQTRRPAPNPAPWQAVLARVFPDMTAKKQSPPNESVAKTVLFDAFAQCLLSLGQAVIVFEDLQWADNETLEFLAWFAPQLASAPLLLCATCRPSPRLDALRGRAERDAWLHRILLAPLNQNEIIALMTRLAPAQSAMSALAERIYKTTSGNPLFVASVLARLFETGQLWRDETGGWQGIPALLAAPVLPIPDQVESLVTQRMATLEPQVKQLLTLAAVAGENIATEFLREAYARAYQTVEIATWLAWLDELADADLAYVAPDHRFTFRHDSVREAVYARASLARRQYLHDILAALIAEKNPDDVTRLAHHLSRSVDGERAIPHLIQAGRQATRLYANTTALAFFERALSIVQQTKNDRWRNELLQIHIWRADLAFKLGLKDLRESVIRDLRQLAPQLTGTQRADALTQVAYAVSEMDRHREVIQITDAILPELGGAEYARQRLNLWRVRGYAMWELGYPTDMRECFQQAIVAGTELNRVQTLISPHAHIGLAHSYLGLWDDAFAELRVADELAAQVNDPFLRGIVSDTWAEVWLNLGAWDSAEAAIAQGESLFKQTQMERARLTSALERGQLALGRGDYAGARAHLQAAESMARAQDRPASQAHILAMLGVAAARQQDWTNSNAYFAQAIDTLTELESQMLLQYACAHSALAQLAQGKVHRAQEILHCAARAPFNLHTALYHLASARVLTALGHMAQANAELTQARQLVHDQVAHISDENIRAQFLAHPHNCLILAENATVVLPLSIK